MSDEFRNTSRKHRQIRPSEANLWLVDDASAV